MRSEGVQCDIFFSFCCLFEVYVAPVVVQLFCCMTSYCKKVYVCMCMFINVFAYVWCMFTSG